MTARDLFVEEARAVTLAEALDRLPIGKLSGASTTGERIGPCPVCGGKDRFAVNPSRGKWNCRGSTGGRDALSLAAHLLSLDLRRATDFMEACAAVTGRPVPDGEGESAVEAVARQARLSALREKAAREAARQEHAAADFREKERAKARGKWEHAITDDGLHVVYLARRLDAYAHELPALPFLRTIPTEAYWHGQDERRNPLSIHDGPAMVAPFVDADGAVIGCHLTWIDLDARPKFRPVLFAPSESSSLRFVADGDPERLPTKKMRGTKKGGLIPLHGFAFVDGRIVPEAGRTRLATGEGIENTIAVALAEGPREDTLYAAAGDLGNLAGPADPASAFTHPELKRPDRNGVHRAVRVQGPVPKDGQAADEAMPLPEGVTSVLLIADGDSEVWATASAMARAAARFGALGAAADIAWPPRGLDFADLVSASPLESASHGQD